MAVATVAILAGGFGTRLRERCGEIPKPMVPIDGKPVLEHQIKLCKHYGLRDIALLVCYGHEQISSYFGDGSDFGVNLQYIVENEPRGTAGAILDALPFLGESFLVLYGDTYLDVDLARFWDAHKASNASGTLLLHPNDHPHDSDLVVIDNNYRVKNILAYPHPPNLFVRNLVNAALYVLDKKNLDVLIPSSGVVDLAKQTFPEMIRNECYLHGYITTEYIKDMGTPERLDRVERDINYGLVEALSSRQLHKAVFIDRDGTLNYEVDHLKSTQQLELLPSAASAVRQLNLSGTLAIVITNQPVVARGDINLKQLEEIHGKLEMLLGVSGAYIDRLYMCPHHPDAGYEGEIAELKTECLCRKPKPGLIDRACFDLNINRSDSWMVGDTTSDIEAGRRAGLKTILVRSGYAGTDAKYVVKPDYICNDLGEAVSWILSGHSLLTHQLLPIAIRAFEDCRTILIGGLARAGKSFAAQVLKELMLSQGRSAHVISLDGWLKPRSKRSEGTGVTERYDLQKISEVLGAVGMAKSRRTISEPLYDRATGISGDLIVRHSIGPSDILIIEGVPALLAKELLNLPKTLKVYVDIDSAVRAQRLGKDYSWRGLDSLGLANVLTSRERDEVPDVVASSSSADFILNSRNL
jgi:histidinol-phosphate phosphatase family protein